MWNHAPLSNVSSDHSTGTSATLSVQAVPDGMWVFVRRSVTSYSLPATIPNTAVTLKLNLAGAATYNFKVFGIEMVNIPQNNFYVGDGASTSAFTSRWINNTDEKVKSKVENLKNSLINNFITDGNKKEAKNICNAYEK